MRTSFLHCFLFFFCVILCGAGPSSKGVVAVSGADSRIAYMGRIACSDGKVRMGFPGVSIRFVYRGTAPILRFSTESPDCYFNLSCNGWDPVVIRLKQGANVIPLPTGRAPQAGWLVELVRRTESWMGIATFEGLQLPEGCELLNPPPWPKRKLLFIGDSPTCGVLTERYPPEDDSSKRSTNAARSYAMLLAKRLDSQVHLVAYGGKGITRDWSGKTSAGILPEYFSRALPDDKASVWNPAQYQPDLILINPGIDFDIGQPEEVAFTDAYAAFVDQIRKVHPTSFIVLAESPILSDGSNGKAKTSREQLLRTLEAVALRRRGQGDPRIRVVRCSFYPGTLTDPHLVTFQQEQLALELLGPTREAMGW